MESSVTSSEFKNLVKHVFGSQHAAAKFMGVWPGTMSRWCRGTLKVPVAVQKLVDLQADEKARQIAEEPSEAPETPPEPRGRRAMRVKAFSLTCLRLCGSLDAARRLLEATEDEFNEWLAGTAPIPRGVEKVLAGEADPPRARQNTSRRYQRVAGPNTRYGVTTPEGDYATVVSAARAYGISEASAYMRAKRNNMGWSFVSYGEPDNPPPRAVRRAPPGQRVVTPQGIYPSVAAAAEAHGVPYQTAYARARKGACDWGYER